MGLTILMEKTMLKFQELLVLQAQLPVLIF